MSPAGVRRPGTARRADHRWELLTSAPLGAVQAALAWMLPRASHAEYCLLAAALVLFAGAALLDWRPRRTAALVALTGLASAAGFLTAPRPLVAADVVGICAALAAASAVALAASVRRYRLRTPTRPGDEQEPARPGATPPAPVSWQDPLTGLANRRQWDAELGRACEAARRDGAAVAVLLLDLDRLRSINERHGHPAGDAVLRQVAALVAGAVGDGGLAARLGGDELSVLLPGAPVGPAALLAEQLRARIAGLRPGGFGPGEVTVSIGVAGAVGEQAFPLELMARADQQLYLAKITRNRVGAPGSAPVPAPRTSAEPMVAGS